MVINDEEKTAQEVLHILLWFEAVGKVSSIQFIGKVPQFDPSKVP